jgi:hypothetical protein
VTARTERGRTRLEVRTAANAPRVLLVDRDFDGGA